MQKKIDLTGQKFGRWTVLGDRTRRGKKVFWNCVCECGTERLVERCSLMSSHSKSCGCLRSERCASLKYKHGMRKTGTYNSWSSMIERCTNSSHLGFRHYGGRGIQVCDRWMKLENFYEDMGPRPEGTSLDRYPDVNGNYEPGNCRWATKKQQCDNRRSTYWIEFEGEVMTLTEASRRSGLSRRVLRNRYPRLLSPPPAGE